MRWGTRTAADRTEPELDRVQMVEQASGALALVLVVTRPDFVVLRRGFVQGAFGGALDSWPARRKDGEN